MNIEALRQEYHWQIRDRLIRVLPSEKRELNYPSFADSTNSSSCEIAWGILFRLEAKISPQPPSRQSYGSRFANITATFVEKSIQQLRHSRSGSWSYFTRLLSPPFDQSEHKEHSARAEGSPATPPLALEFDCEFVLTPDIIVGRTPLTDTKSRRHGEVVEAEKNVANTTLSRSSPFSNQYLHASISCKWKVQNSPTDGSYILASYRDRKRNGRFPHIAVVTAEPLPTRIAAVALGARDVDCVYHFALHEMRAAIKEIDNEDQMDMLNIMVQGKRLRDISDLPFDLAM